MALTPGRYLEGTRHPWACLVFVVPLLLAYEGGHILSGTAPVAQARNGAERWLRLGLAFLGFPIEYSGPALLGIILLGWSFVRRHDRPSDLVGLSIGMAVESAIFALGLYVISRALVPIFDALGVALSTSLPRGHNQMLHQVISYLGAGIYEEAMFRLGLFTVLCWLFHLADFSPRVAIHLGAIASALIFAGAHHLEANAEPFHAAVFLYRTLAGYYFAWIYRLRGLGVAVGAHAGYDVLVGALLPNM